MDANKAIRVKKRIIRRSQDIVPMKSCEASDDETSSICSDHSHISPCRKKKLKRIRRSCPIHGKQHMIKKYGEKAYDMPEFDKFKDIGLNVPSEKKAGNSVDGQLLNCDSKATCGFEVQGQSSASQLMLQNVPSSDQVPKCICDKTTKVHRSSKNRPEPEGSLLAWDFMDEFEKTVYNNDPLFSDLEDNPELDAQVKTESDRFHKRSSQSVMNIFASALSFNTNTMMKFAIIQTELKNLIEIHVTRVYFMFALLQV